MLNKVTLMGRLTRDPMVKYSQGGTAIARYTLAIDRRPGKNGEQVTDFIDCVAFGSSGKFVEKYLRKGRKIVACGKLELNSYTKEDGTKVYALDVVMNEHYFADDKIPEEAHNNNNPQQPVNSLKDPNYDPIPMPNNNQATGNTNSMADSMSMPAMDPIPEVPTVEPAFNGTEMEIPGELLEDLPIGE
mgnify:FL=1